MTDRSCSTRSLKVAHHLQRTRPDIVPAVEPLEGFGSILEGSDPSLRFVLRDAFGPAGVPSAGTKAVAPLFNGSLVFLRLNVTVGSRSFALSPSDLGVALQFAGGAVAQITRYAAQYGPNTMSVTASTVEVPVSLPKGVYNDATVQQWVNAVVAAQHLDGATTAIVILNPPGPLNTDADPGRGVLGYHGLAAVPYAFVNVMGTGLTVSDPADLYALALSHELAELAVDPSANLANPEVCDPCGPNCQTPIRSYFDQAGAFLGATTAFPPPFPYGLFLNAIVQPAAANQCPAPASACAYAPPPDATPRPSRRG
ncbi:MAG: hypothetical protein L3K18_01765 [Thermoplasmata archaeon]|nr:hypothetical protein [Thermoplasmata archaeon]